MYYIEIDAKRDGQDMRVVSRFEKLDRPTSWENGTSTSNVEGVCGVWITLSNAQTTTVIVRFI